MQVYDGKIRCNACARERAREEEGRTMLGYSAARYLIEKNADGAEKVKSLFTLFASSVAVHYLCISIEALPCEGERLRAMNDIKAQ